MKLGFGARVQPKRSHQMKFNWMVSADCANSASRTSAITRQNGENQMTRMKTLSAVIILSAAVASPVFAQDAGVRRPQPGPTHHGRAYDLWNYRRAYNQLDGPFYASPRAVGGWSNENSDSKGKDPSRVGGEDPYLHPGG
jgi:hypothetical protein